MLEVASVFVCLICLGICMNCVERRKQVEADQDKILKNWYSTLASFEKSVKLNDEIIKHCRTVINRNDELIDINTDLRLEVDNLKMVVKENIINA